MKKRGRGAWCLLFLGIILLLGIFFYRRADEAYREEKREKYQSVIVNVEALLRQEKEWILNNQGPEGAIYLNHSNGARDVNPYFACQAAMGILAGEVTEEDLSSVADYLSWHTEELIRHEGLVTNYRDRGEGLEPTGSYDSVDSYVALYLTLLGEYGDRGGDLNAVEGWEEAVAYCASQLDGLYADGLTWTKEELKVFYLMDNGEVWEGCKSVSRLPLKEDLKQFYAQMAEEVSQSIREELWNGEEDRFEIGLDEDREPLGYEPWKELYPDGIVQVFLKACGFSFDREKEEELYEELCRHFSWETLELDGNFYWTVMSYIAMEMEDTDRVEAFLDNYTARFTESREYPFHTAEVGWTARTCGKLMDFYRDRMETGILEDFLLHR